MKNLIRYALLVALATTPLFAARIATVTITESVSAGSVTLAPGDYKVSVQGTGPAVKVTLTGHGAASALLDAHWIAGKKGNGEVVVGTANGVRILREIDLNSGTLVFDLPQPAN